MKLFLRCSGLLLGIIVLVIAFIGWSETALKFLVSEAESRLNGTFQAGAVQGALISGWQMEDVRIHTDSVEIQMANISTSYSAGELFSLRLHMWELAFSDVEVTLLEPEEPESARSSTASLQLPEIAAPLAFLIDRIRVNDFRLLGGDGSELTRIYTFESGVSLISSVLSLDDLKADAEGYELRLDGNVNTADSWRTDLSGFVKYGQYGVRPVSGTVSVSGPLNELYTRVDLDEPAQGYVEGVISELPNDFVWKAKLDLNGVQLADFHQSMPIMDLEVKGEAYGSQARYGGRLTGTMNYLFLKDLAVDIELDGDQNQIAFHQVDAEADYGKVRLTDGVLSWVNALAWQGKLVFEDVDLNNFTEDFEGNIAGSLVSSGSYDPSGLEIEADLKDVVLQRQDLEITGKGGIHIKDKTIAVSGVELEHDDSFLSLNGSVTMAKGYDRWRESLQWNADMQVEAFDPSLLEPQYPGAINADLRSHGRLTGETLAGVVELGSLSGEVRDYPVRGEGTIQLQDEVFGVEWLILQSGDTSLEVSGRVGKLLDLDLAFKSPDLGEILHGGEGKVTIRGNLTGPMTRPDVSAKVEADGIVYHEYGVGHLAADISGGLDEEKDFSVRLTGSELKSGTLLFDSGEFSLQGNRKEHRFTSTVSGHDGSLVMEGSGGLGSEMQWSGKITDMRIAHPDTGDLSLKNPAAITASSKSASVADFCLQNNEEQICLSAESDIAEKQWDVQLGWQNVQLARLSDFMDLMAPLKGVTMANLSAGGTGPRIDKADGRLEVRNATFGESKDMSQYENMRLDTAVVSIDVADKRLNTVVDVDFADGSTVDLTAAVNDFGSLGKDALGLPLTGKLKTNVDNLEFIGPVTNYLVQPTGSLQGQLEIAGTVSRPEVSGDLALKAGTIDLPAWGISMTGAQLSVEAADRKLDLAGKANSGPGWLEASGSLEFGEDGIDGSFRFIGEDFDTLMLPEYQIRTSPDLNMTFNAKGAELTGTLKVPYAVLMPKEMSGSVAESEDVVYTDRTEENTKPGGRFSTTLQVELGEDVFLDAYGLTGYLRGDLEISKTPDTLLTGKGELSLVDGVFSVYGKTLNIVRSRVLFFGGPLDNPGLDVRAEKVVADKQIRGESIRVGVDVGGTVEDLEFTLFSYPPMEESDILSYMVVGRSMSETGKGDESSLSSAALLFGLDKSVDYIQGLTNILPVDEVYIDGGGDEDVSLVLGKQVTDKLFIGYDHNFFEQEGELRLRYDLNKGFSVETRSSGESTGADLWYSFEN